MEQKLECKALQMNALSKLKVSKLLVIFVDTYRTTQMPENCLFLWKLLKTKNPESLDFQGFAVLRFSIPRRKRDSNPRSPRELNGFQDRRIRPLCHFSTAKIYKISFLQKLN